MTHESVFGLAISMVRPSDAMPFADMDDAALVAAAVAGERDAFDVIVERHRRAVYQVCYRFVNNHEDASDLAQDAFVRAWRGLENFKGEAALSTWLYRIAVNVCLNRLSSKAARTATEAIESVDQFEDVRIEGAQHAMIREERAAVVRTAIAALADETTRDADHARVSRHVAPADRRRVGQFGRRSESKLLSCARELEEVSRNQAMTHLTPDELIDALEGARSPAHISPNANIAGASSPISPPSWLTHNRRACPNRRRCSGRISPSAFAPRSIATRGRQAPCRRGYAGRCCCRLARRR